jgi:hypothetical protein
VRTHAIAPPPAPAKENETEEDDERPTRRPPPVAELAKGVFDSDAPETREAHDETPTVQLPSTELESIAPGDFEMESDEGTPIHPAAELRTDDDADQAEGDDLPTLPPTRPEPDDDEDEEPTIVEPFAYFAAQQRAGDGPTTDRPSDDRPTDRSLRVAAPVPVDAAPSPPPAPPRRASEPRRPPEPPPAPRAQPVREVGPAAISYPPSPAPAVRVMAADSPTGPASVPPLSGAGSISAVAMAPQQVVAAPLYAQAAPSAPPVGPTFASEMFRSSLRRKERSKVSNVAAALAALVVVAGAGYLGAVSGKTKATTPAPAPTEESSITKGETPPPVTTALQNRDPAPAPSPSLETPPATTARTREDPAPPPPPPTPPPPTPRETAREPAPRRTTSDEDSARTRTSDTPRPQRTRTPRPPAEDEGSSSTPETRLPDPTDAPAKPSIDQAALRAAFAEGEVKAKSCLGATSPSGTARISVTFAPSGEAVGAIVGGSPFANTLEGQCMAAKFRTLHVPAFTGAEVIVRKSISFL